MPLVVEDGTGLDTAESYITLAAFKAYCDGRGMVYSPTPDAVLEQKLRIATSYIDTVRRYKGQRLNAAQALEFPRANLTDFGGLAVSGIPKRVRDACAELAFFAISENLYQNLDRGGKVKSESVGPISTTYADDAPAGKEFTSAMRLLDPYVRNERDVGSPYFVAQTPEFELTTMDHPGFGDVTQ